MTFEKRVQDKNKMFPIMLLKLIEWVVFKLFAISCYKFAMKVKNYYAFYLKSPSKSSYVQLPSYPSVTKCDLQNRESQTIVCDIHGSLLRTHSFFPFFMLIAFEGGSIFRAFLLLLSCPILLFLDFELKLRVMTFITFCGLNKKYVELVGNAVFPKFYLENLNRHVYEVLGSTGVKMVFTSMPRVMVESFLKEYLSVDNVIGTELQMVGNYFTGFMTNSGLLNKHKALKEFFGEKKPDIGIGSSTSYDHLFISQCKEAYVVDKEDTKSGSKSSSILPREKYPKPLVFHDGRLAFLPTPLASLITFMWLPLAIPLAIFRISVGALPMKISLLLGCFSGIDLKVKYVNNQNSQQPSKIKNGSGSGVLYVCTHRTLLDPVMLSASLQRPVTAVTYSLSKLTEIIAPIKTVRLTRNRAELKVESKMDSIQHKILPINGLNMHIAEVGEGPLVLFIHGFPELWFSWRHQLLFLASHGFHAVALDLRGYGDTTGAPLDDFSKFSAIHVVGDIVALLDKIVEDKEEKVFVVGHDWGALMAWFLCLWRPDKVKALVNLSVPYLPRDPTTMPIDKYRSLYGDDHYICRFQEPGDIEAELAPIGIKTVMQKFLTYSSPQPFYFPKGKGFGDSSATPHDLPSWLPEEDLEYFAKKFEKTGLTGGINYYRAFNLNWELTAPWAGAQVNVPAKFITGELDLVYHIPGMKEYIHNGGFKKLVPLLEDIVVIEGAAHFVQQERPEEISLHIYDFIKKF